MVAIARAVGCAAAPTLLLRGLQLLLDGALVTCPECAPILLPLLTVAYAQGVVEIEKACR